MKFWTIRVAREDLPAGLHTVITPLSDSFHSYELVLMFTTQQDAKIYAKTDPTFRAVPATLET